MGTREYLIAVKSLIDAPEKWDRGSAFYAYVKQITASGEIMIMCVEALDNALSDDFIDLNSFRMSPKTKHADVMALFDRAIARARASSTQGDAK